MRLEDDKTPTVIHPRPAPVVVRAGTGKLGAYPLPPLKHNPTPRGIAPVSDPEVFLTDEEPTRPDGKQARAACLLSDWASCAPEHQAYLERTARRYAEQARSKKEFPNGRY